MAITRINRNQKWDRDGNLIEDVQVVEDITAEVTADDLYTKARQALASNKAFLDTPNAQITNADALQQIKRLTRQVDGLIRLLPRAGDLLVENDDT